MSAPVIVATPPAVAHADRYARTAEKAWEAESAIRVELQRQMAAIRAQVLAAEEREHTAALVMDAARRDAAIARRRAGLKLTASGDTRRTS